MKFSVSILSATLAPLLFVCAVPAQDLPGAWKEMPSMQASPPLEPDQPQPQQMAAPSSFATPSVSMSLPPASFWSQGNGIPIATSNDADYQTDEIKNLARSLGWHSGRIYEFVRNNIFYEHYYGSKKGAHLTLLERSGNDLDQSALLVALLRASGHPCQYQDLKIRLALVESTPGLLGANQWWGLASTIPADYPANTYSPSWTWDQRRAYQAMADHCERRGFSSDIGGQLTYIATDPGRLYLLTTGVKYKNAVLTPWAKAQVKSTETFTASGIGFNKTNFLNSLGGQTGQNGAAVGGLSMPVVKSALATAAASVSSLLAGPTYVNQPAGKATGKPEIVPMDLSDQAPSLAFLQSGDSPDAFDLVPTDRMSVFTLTMAYPDASKPADKWGQVAEAISTSAMSIKMPALRGQRLSVRTNSARDKIQFYKEDELWFERAIPQQEWGYRDLNNNNQYDPGEPKVNAPTANYFITMEAKHPNLNPFIWPATYTNEETRYYALIYSFNASQASLRFRQEILNEAYSRALQKYPSAFIENGKPIANGKIKYERIADLVLRRRLQEEALNVMGTSWLYQTQLYYDILAYVNAESSVALHRFGRTYQSESYTIDVGLELRASAANDRPRFFPRKQFIATGWLGSALENGIIEQQEGSPDSAVSTIQILNLANLTAATGTSIFKADASNWASVRPQLTGYSEGLLNSIGTYLTPLTPSSWALIPRNAQVGPEKSDWSGNGYVLYATSGSNLSLLMAIDGLSGGESFNHSVLSPVPVVTNYFTNPTYNVITGTSVISSPNTPSYSFPSYFSWDPVDMASGAFVTDREDLIVGQTGVRGLRFAPSYNSARRDNIEARLGYGWTHNYAMRAVERTAPEAAFGDATAPEAATMIAATLILRELVSDTATCKELVAGAMVAKAATDHLLNNAVSIQLGESTMQFIKQADGTYTPPANTTHTLALDGTTYVLRERLGDTYRFDSTKDGRITSITDIDGKVQNFGYDTSGRLSTVTDCYNRKLTFTYNSLGLIGKVTDSTGRAVSYGYDTSGDGTGDLTKATDAAGKATIYSYAGATHRLATIKDPLGRITISNTYDTEGRVMEQKGLGLDNRKYRLGFSGPRNFETDPDNNTKLFFYDRLGRPVATEDALGNRSLISYDGQNHIVSTTTPKAETTTHKYDGDHLLRETTDPLGNKTIYQYDGLKRLIKITLRDNDPQTPVTHDRVTDYHYAPTNSTPRPDKITDPAGRVTRYTYYANNTDPARGQVWEIIQETEAGDRKTIYEYDIYGQPKKITHPDLNFEQFTYSPRGDLLQHRDRKNILSVFTYNMRRQPLKSTVASGTKVAATTSRAYDNAGDLKSVSDPTGRLVSYSTSATGKVLTVTRASGSAAEITTTQYNSRDLPEWTQNPLLKKTGYQHDAAGRLTHVTDPLSKIRETTYDANGLVHETFTPLRYRTENLYDARGILTDQTDPLGRTITHTPDGFGEPTTMRNRRNNKWTFTQNKVGEREKLKSPLNREYETFYDKRGLVQWSEEPSNQRTNFYYDAIGRPDYQTDPIGTIDYTLDKNGNVEKVKEGSAELTRVYDEQNRVVSYTDAAGNKIGYTYDLAGRILTITYPGTPVRKVTYTYNSAGRLATLKDWANRSITYTYDKNGRLKTINLPNRVKREFGYYDDDRLEKLTDTYYPSTGAASQLLRRSFTYDDDGRMRTQTIAPPQSAYTEIPPAATYDADDRLETWGSLTGLVNDPDGNLTYGPDLDATTLVNYSYDARNRLTSALGRSYTYDAENNRISQTGSEGTTNYVIDPHGGPLPRVLVRKTPTSNKQIFYVYGVGLAFEVEIVTNGTTVTQTPRYYHTDHLGSTIAITKHTGTASDIVTDRMYYTPYGKLKNRIGTTDTPFLFVGALGVMTDNGGSPTDGGLIYMRARYYHPGIMRFLNADPIGFGGGPNWYSYANGNPVSNVDPDGHFAQFVIGAAVGIAVQGAIDLYRGETSSFATYAGAAAGGALTGGLSSLVRGAGTAALVGAAGGATSNAYRQGIEVLQGNRTELSASSFALETGFGAAGSAVASRVVPAALSRLSNSTKGDIGEYTSLASNLAQGNIPTNWQFSTGIYKGRAPVWDWEFQNVFTGASTIVESKFGTARFTAAQRAGAPYLPNLKVEKWTYGFWGQAGAAGGGIGGSAAGRK